MVAYHQPFNIFTDQTNPLVPWTPTGEIAVTGTNVYPGRTMGPAGAMYHVSLQMSVITGTPTGTVTLEVSNDPRCADPVLQFTTARWVVIETVPVVAGVVQVPNAVLNNANGMVAFPNGARYFRMVYTNASGSGTMTFWATGVSGV